MDFVTGLPQTQRRHDAIWVVVDHLTKSAHFLPFRKDYSVSRLAEIFQQEIENIKLPTEDHVILEKPASSTRTLSSLQNLDKELSFTDQFFMEKPQEEEPEKTNVDSEVQSMVTVPIHQYTSLLG
nr:putative disease resistance RPP13-like protein 1 [Tanacetum cinerariifolium]